MIKGFYSYKVENVDIKTVYTIEFTRDKNALEALDKKGDFDALNKLTFDYFEDAINTFIKLRYDETVLYIIMHEDVLINGEIVLQQIKTECTPALNFEDRIYKAEQTAENYKADNERLRAFLKKHNITDKQIDEI